MYLLDANILLYAINEDFPEHSNARAWLTKQLQERRVVVLTWGVILAFLRLSTTQKVFRNPLGMKEAIAYIDNWLAQPSVRVISAGQDHWSLLKEAILTGKAKGPVVMDAHIAALAIEHGLILVSNDKDFSRFSQLKLENPCH